MSGYIPLFFLFFLEIKIKQTIENNSIVKATLSQHHIDPVQNTKRKMTAAHFTMDIVNPPFFYIIISLSAPHLGPKKGPPTPPPCPHAIRGPHTKPLNRPQDLQKEKIAIDPSPSSFLTYVRNPPPSTTRAPIPAEYPYPARPSHRDTFHYSRSTRRPSPGSLRCCVGHQQGREKHATEE